MPVIYAGARGAFREIFRIVAGIIPVAAAREVFTALRVSTAVAVDLPVPA